MVPQQSNEVSVPLIPRTLCHLSGTEPNHTRASVAREEGNTPDVSKTHRHPKTNLLSDASAGTPNIHSQLNYTFYCEKLKNAMGQGDKEFKLILLTKPITQFHKYEVIRNCKCISPNHIGYNAQFSTKKVPLPAWFQLFSLLPFLLTVFNYLKASQLSML